MLWAVAFYVTTNCFAYTQSRSALAAKCNDLTIFYSLSNHYVCLSVLFFWRCGLSQTCSLTSLDLGSLNMEFQHDWPKDKKITTLLIFFA